MIIAKAPLRISLGGGGTDLESYYSEFESTFLSAAINKYIYISVHETFPKDLIIKYSEMERVPSPDMVKHPIIRECLKLAGIESNLEISSFADIPAGTGLGSSGTFTVSMLKALYTHKGILHDPTKLAADAVDIEINKLNSPIGKQDQYISAFGGIQVFKISKDGTVTARPLALAAHTRQELQDHLLLFFTGYSRSANELLREQDDETKKNLKEEKNEQSMLADLHFVQELGHKSIAALEAGRLNDFSEIMNVHWESKRKRSKNMSNGEIDHYFSTARENGALSGKLIGAGGGGFLMFLAEDLRRLRKAMHGLGLKEVPFRFDDLGAQIALRD